MSATFGYSKEYIQWQMSLMDVYSYTDYLIDNPPAGTVIKTIAEAFFGGTGSETKTESSNPEISNSLEDFIADFTGSGGSIQ